MISNSSPEITFCFSLCQSPLYHTLSNVFEMFKNIPRISRPSSKDLWSSWVMYRSCLIHESPGLKPSYYTIFFQIFSQQQEEKILGSSFSVLFISFSVCWNHIAFFHPVGNFQFPRYDLNINSKVLQIEASQIFIIQILIISWPCTFFGSRFLIHLCSELLAAIYVFSFK